MSAIRTLTPIGVRSDTGRPWVSVLTRRGYVDLDSHGFARPLSATDARHIARRLQVAADALDAQAPEPARTALVPSLANPETA